MWQSGAFSNPRLSDAANTAIAFGVPVAIRFVTLERSYGNCDIGPVALVSVETFTNVEHWGCISFMRARYRFSLTGRS
jgi:hypothetical protein